MTKKNKEPERATAIVTFHYCTELTNVSSGDREEYHVERRNGLLCSTNYIVKIEIKEEYVIEYDLFPLRYNRFEAEPEASLYDYLLFKYNTSKEYLWDAMYKDVIFQCPDTAETYTMDYVKNKYKEELKAVFGEIDECTEKENVEK